jgi:hypothetical protein
MTKDELYNAIQEEWASMHHNAYIHRLPSFQNDFEVDIFWKCLSEDISFWIEDLENSVKEKYGYDWKFYQYGRMGATVAPNNLKRPSACDSFAGLKSDCIPDNYKDMMHLYRALCFSNTYVKNIATHIPSWWEDIKEANDYQKIIEKHDGKRKIMVEQWVY